LSAVQRTSTTSSELGASKWGAFGHAAFAVIWIASIVSYVGTAMFDTASGWLMTSLSADPLAVSLVQVAVSLPLFLFTLPAGALADVIDSRRLLILIESLIVAVSAVFAALVSFGLPTFADDALVNDQLRDYWGKPAIREWAARDIIGASLTMDVTNVIEHYGNFIVTANVSGNLI
jgi:MFS family permease